MTNVDYFFGCNDSKKPNKFALALENRQLFSRVSYRIIINASKKIDKDNVNVKIDGVKISSVDIQKQKEKMYQIEVSSTNVQASIELDVKDSSDFKDFKFENLLIENCTDYKEDGSCSKCESSYFLNEETSFCSNQFVNCDDYQNNICLKCKDGYLLNSSGFCSITCSVGQHKFNNSCVNECPEGFYSDQNQFCKQCGEFCISCNSYNNCLKCEQNMYLLEGICQQKCSDGYFIINNDQISQQICQKCDQSCNTCIGPSKSECDSCGNDLMFHLGSICLDQCPEGYFKTTDSQRAQQVNNKSTYYCAKCYYSNQKCVESCPSQSLLSEDYICKTCSTKNCTKCNSSDICMECSGDYFLDGNNFCIQCHQNTYFDSNTKTCKICPDSNCLKCSNQQNGNVCLKCKQFYEFNQTDLICQFNDVEYLLECANPSNCQKEQNIVKASDATINIISISNTVLLLFSFLFFPIGPFFWYTVQVQQQIGNMILINNLRILSLGPTVIQNFYQYNIFPLFPDSKFNTYEESDLLYASSSQLSLMASFRSQPLKKYFINNMAYFFIVLFTLILIYLVSKCINYKYIKFQQKIQAQKKLKSSQNNSQFNNSMPENSSSFNNSRSIEQQDNYQVKLDQQNHDEINEIGQNLIVKNEQEKQQKKVNFYKKNEKLLKRIEFNLFIRFQKLFGNYFLISLFFSVQKISLKSNFDYIDLGIKSFFTLIYITLVFYLVYKISAYDKQGYDQDPTKFQIIFSNIKMDGLKKYFWIFLELRKIIQIAVLVFVQHDLVKISTILGTNLLFFIYLAHQKPISFSIYQKFIFAIEIIIIFTNICIQAYIMLPDSMINQKFLATILAIMTLTILNFIVLGFLIMQIYMFVKFKFFPRFYILENKVIDTMQMELSEGQNIRNSRFFKDMTNTDIDYYSKLWGINPIFAQQIYQQAQDEFRKKYENEQIKAQLQQNQQVKQTLAENSIKQQNKLSIKHREIHGTLEQKRKLQQLLSQSLQFKQISGRESRRKVEQNITNMHNIFSKNNVFETDQNQTTLGSNLNNLNQKQRKDASDHKQIIELQRASQKQSTESCSSQQKTLKLIKSKNCNQNPQDELQKGQFSSCLDSI